jgi:hypothetical protein
MTAAQAAHHEELPQGPLLSRRKAVDTATG